MNFELICPYSQVNRKLKDTIVDKNANFHIKVKSASANDSSILVQQRFDIDSRYTVLVPLTSVCDVRGASPEHFLHKVGGHILSG